ncbi:uncharacterized protein EV420DRAFT_1582136 [Desarmillaria tabescens]|uniref:Uncharacterized protein n=1 Tax=Armillaria tabescens TaxID=1929756 RepID=A0AA39JCF3_ARMTA|nr:uncharacterized protein EV420DRAFT_1582136 [Desarmillaria tabescens]KAK0440197.1 hypothetical protein EV420DRAFT_1582136 [Desarmillaria tabescens]
MSVYRASPSTATRHHAPQSRVSDRIQHLPSHSPSHASFKGPPAVISGSKVGSFVPPAPSAAPSHHSSSRSRAFAPPSHVSSAAYRHSSAGWSMAPSTVLPSDSASQVGGSVIGSPPIVPTPSVHHSSSHISRSLSHSVSASPAVVPAPIPSHVSRHVPSVAPSHSSSHSRALSAPSSSNNSKGSGYSVIHAKPSQMVIVPLAHGGCVIVPPKGKRVTVSKVWNFFPFFSHGVLELITVIPAGLRPLIWGSRSAS